MALADLEGAAARVVADLIASGVPPPPGSIEYLRLVTFIVFQWGRTPTAGEVMDAIATKTTRALLKTSGLVPEDMRKDIDSITVQYKSSVTNSLKLAASMPHLLFDLGLKIIVNKTSTEFITSDAPVVLFNQWCQGLRGMGATGLACHGLQIFLPLSATHALVFYDPAVYTVGKRRSSTIELSSAYDVVGINRLQLVAAEENLYYSGAPATAKAIDELPFQWRRSQAQAVEVHRAVEVDGNSELIHVYHEPSDARLNIPSIKVSKRAREIPARKRTSMYREMALQADEIVNGPREARYGTPPNGPRTWRIVDD